MIRCKCSHRGKAETRFFRALLAIIVWMILEGGLLRVLAGEQDALFWQDIGDVGAPFQPVEVLPMELGERFIPATGQAQAISFSYHAANHRYQLDGLWNDLGITKHLLEDKEMTQEAYIRRFGFPAGRKVPMGRTMWISTRRAQRRTASCRRHSPSERPAIAVSRQSRSRSASWARTMPWCTTGCRQREDYVSGR